ncbi:MAG: metallophosphoesterase [Candidatus Bathyarchaeia archaeon]
MIKRIFYATDIHGSEVVFRKFVSAGRFYKADIVILDGDLTGKAIVPIINKGDGSFEADVLGERYLVNRDEAMELENRIRNLGFYPLILSEDELEDLRGSPRKVDKLFEDMMVREIRKWVSLIEQNLKNSGIDCYVLPGNDDRFEIDKELEGSDYIVNPEGRVVDLDGVHEMISSGWSNPTPWNTPREESEEELGRRIEAMASKVKNMENCVFNLHCPPYDTGIDNAPQLDENLRQVVKAGELIMVPVGSKSVRQVIEKYQPLIGLHGHIHESKGARKVGRTLCVNPGSEYQQGTLKGVIVNLDDKGVKSFMFTSG